eukprot:CAMPEP_0171619110 /NCGR_PEP_ID=MMETSP0990-20121206/15172_1 /TAXON_ID=483369 /ORGANISM="non described non described, Strain CCMP2098" /LENGTH=162 /DNA_ID=CAMNT_0012184093 /DNA_START=668 /DNA_END=1156 /DNA_ORIENTATION=+
MQGSISVGQFIAELMSAENERTSDNDDRKVNAAVHAVLTSMRDPGRRATLRLRFLKLFNEARTPCCQALHYFSCTVAGTHPGFSCAQFQASKFLDDEAHGKTRQCDGAMPYPSGGLRLTKGDGCNAVQCPCREKFNWSAQKVAMMKDLSEMFAMQHIRCELF